MSRDSEAFYWALLIVLVAIWGSAFAFIKTAVADMHPAWVAVWRLWSASAVLMIAARVTGEPVGGLRPRLSRDSPAAWYALVGVFGMAVPFMLFGWSAQTLPSAVNAICNGASPIFTALFAHMLFASERMTLRKSLGTGMGFVGLIVLVGPAAFQGANADWAWAELAAILGAALYAAANVAIKGAPPLGSISGALTMAVSGAITATVLALIWAGPPTAGTPMGWVSILYLGIFPTALASIGYVYLVRRRGALFTAFATYLAPVWATIIGITIMGERPGANAFVALALILAGVAAANLRPRARDGAVQQAEPS